VLSVVLHKQAGAPVFRELYSEKRVVDEERRQRVDGTPLGAFQQVPTMLRYAIRRAAPAATAAYQRRRSVAIGTVHDLDRKSICYISHAQAGMR
jgi:hypothetical protein